ncbi:hypothetical protein BH23BAC2_BH23BAC2_25350 [soil metagenome]
MKKLFPLFLMLISINSISQDAAGVAKNLFSVNFLMILLLDH